MMSVSQHHTVTLPHPSPAGEGVTVVCSCEEWGLTYAWGRHGWAESEAYDHIREAALAEPISMRTLDGTITVMPGVSL